MPGGGLGVGTFAEPKLERAFRGHRGSVTAVSFCPDEQQVISSSADGCIFVWHFKPQLRPYRFVGHKGEVYDVAVSSTGQRFASASADQTVRLWSNTAQGESHVMKAHTAPVRSVCFSRDDSMLLTASDDKTLKMWCTGSRKFKGSFVGHTNWVYSGALSKDSNLAASGGEDRTVRIWDCETKASLMTFQDFEAPVSKVQFHPDGSCLAACGRDGCIKLWDLRSRRLLQHYDAHEGAALSIAFRGDGECLLSAAEDETMKLWDLREGRLLYKVVGHKKAPAACAFAPSGRSFVSGGRDGLVFIWDCTGSGTQGAAASSGEVVAEVTKRDAPEPARPRASSASPTASSRCAAAAASRRTRPSSATGSARSSAAAAAAAASAAATGKATGAGRSTATGAATSGTAPGAFVPWSSKPAGTRRRSPMRQAAADPLPPPAAPPPATLQAQAEELPGASVRDDGLDALPEPLTQTLRSMQGHLEIMGRTVQLLERRLAMTEQQVFDMRKELLKSQSTSTPVSLETIDKLLGVEVTAVQQSYGSAESQPAPAPGAVTDIRLGGVMTRQQDSQSQMRVLAGPPWYITHNVTPAAAPKDMGGWTSVQFTPVQQSRYGVNADGDVANPAVHAAALKQGSHSGSAPTKDIVNAVAEVVNEGSPSKVVAGVGPPWYIVHNVIPGAPEKNMGGFSVVQFTFEQQAKYGVDADGEVLDPAVHAASFKEGNHRRALGSGPPWYIVNNVTPAALPKDMGGWSAVQFTAEQQATYGVNADGGVVDPAVHAAAFK